MPNIDHDALFKELLTTFFADFIQLFLPKLHQAIDWSTLVFGEPESGQRLRVASPGRVIGPNFPHPSPYKTPRTRRDPPHLKTILHRARRHNHQAHQSAQGQ